MHCIWPHSVSVKCKYRSKQFEKQHRWYFLASSIHPTLPPRSHSNHNCLAQPFCSDEDIGSGVNHFLSQLIPEQSMCTSTMVGRALPLVCEQVGCFLTDTTIKDFYACLSLANIIDYPQRKPLTRGRIPALQDSGEADRTNRLTGRPFSSEQ